MTEDELDRRVLTALDDGLTLAELMPRTGIWTLRDLIPTLERLEARHKITRSTSATKATIYERLEA